MLAWTLTHKEFVTAMGLGQRGNTSKEQRQEPTAVFGEWCVYGVQGWSVGSLREGGSRWK